MIDSDLLEKLCCPESFQPLSLAEPALIQRLNELIAAGRLKNRGTQPVTERIDGGLIRADRKFLYPVRSNIPILLIDEAIPVVA